VFLAQRAAQNRGQSAPTNALLIKGNVPRMPIPGTNYAKPKNQGKQPLFKGKTA